MENNVPFFQDPTVNLILFIFGAIGWVFGIVSTIVTIRSSISQKKREKAYNLLLDQASLDWDGKYTKEQIAELKNQFNSLHNQIKNEIPKLAKKSLLESQAENLRDSITTQYQKLKDINEKLKEKTQLEYLSFSIKKDIENELMPDHIKKQKINRIFQILTIIILVLAIVPFILPLIYLIFY